jgi:hypothetical protein
MFTSRCLRSYFKCYDQNKTPCSVHQEILFSKDRSCTLKKIEVVPLNALSEMRYTLRQLSRVCSVVTNIYLQTLIRVKTFIEGVNFALDLITQTLAVIYLYYLDS